LPDIHIPRKCPPDVIFFGLLPLSLGNLFSAVSSLSFLLELDLALVLPLSNNVDKSLQAYGI
jgi:hypothetical protein